ncbi:MAG: acid phosphatase type 7 [Actinomycetota bacterium]|nr:acid phosphatase type 7 [Actinomycetota bacterium]
MVAGRLIGALSALAVVAGISLPAPGSASTGALAPALRRYPYLTDLVVTSVEVNWATDQSGTSASATWGAVDGGGRCVPTNTLTAIRTSITVNSVPEYQWAAVLSLPAAGTYCYRVFLGATDLLGSDPSPRFATQIPAGSPASFSFAVFGDWGQVGSNGANADQANLMSQIAQSGVKFAMTVGDNGYPSGSQTNYGDLQQSGSGISEIFGPSFWAVPGRSIPLFASSGNHGISSSTATRSTEQVNWPETTAASTSGGRYVRDTYCCVNGTSSASYPSSWYAFDAGPARFYVLQADWADLNVGAGTVYSDDYAAHWSRNSPEYQWLAADLAAHPSGLKFAFFHYPLYSDQKAQTSDPYLQGSNSLEGLLATNHVSIAFTGHAHIYERNAPTTPGSFPSYVTGGGGATLQTVAEAGCSGFDAYAIGWSPTKLQGSRCGAAAVPDSATRVFHFLKVTVDGSAVTVTPTDELGRTFDVQTYAFGSVSPLPDTVIDDGPAAVTNLSSATFTFHSTQSPATFQCQFGTAAAGPCTSPVTYSGLAEGDHRFSVQATSASGTDPSPAIATWTVDTTAPTAPSSLAATAPTSGAVALTWTAATDSNGIAGYDIARNGVALAGASSSATSYSDTAVAANTTYQYQIVARDPAGNVSAPSNVAGVTTPPAGSGGPVLVQAAGSTTNTVTLATPSAAGDLLVLSAGVYSGATNQITAVTDSAGNAWTRIGAFVVAGHYSDGEMWYSANAGTTSSVTVRTSTATNMAVEVLEFSGVATTAPLEVAMGASHTGNAPGSGSVAPAATNDLVVGFVAGHGNGEAIAVTAPGYTTQQQQTTGASVASVVTGYRVLASASAQSFTGSFPTSMYWAAGIATFRAAAGG